VLLSDSLGDAALDLVLLNLSLSDCGPKLIPCRAQLLYLLFKSLLIALEVMDDLSVLGWRGCNKFGGGVAIVVLRWFRGDKGVATAVKVSFQ
jgi:hypothetical protein